MYQPGMGNQKEIFQFWQFGCDNGRVMMVDGIPMTKTDWDAGNWLEWLASLRRYRERCILVAAPDVIGDADATWRLSAPYLPTIRQLGFPAALVAQNGFDPAEVDWDAFDVLFIGGRNDWKFAESGGWATVAEGKKRGKWVHMGRVNSGRRVRACQLSDVDSADGTFLMHGPDVNWPKLQEWLRPEVNGQLMMDLA